MFLKSWITSVKISLRQKVVSKIHVRKMQTEIVRDTKVRSREFRNHNNPIRSKEGNNK